MTDTTRREPLLHLPSSALMALHHTLAQNRSPADAAALVRQIGYESGEGFLDAFQDWLEHHKQEAGADPAKLSAEEFWQRLSGFFFSLGWGRLEFEQLHAGVASLSSARWAEAEPEGAARQPTCHFTTGLLSDLLGRIVGDDLAVMEVECLSRGDAHCRFLFGSPAALEQVYHRLGEGDSYPAALQRLS